MSPLKRRQLLKATLSASALVISKASYSFSKEVESSEMSEENTLLMVPTTSPPTTSPPTSSPPTSSPPTSSPPTSSPPAAPPAPDFSEQRTIKDQIQLTAPSVFASVNVIPGGASVASNKSYEIALVFQNTSPVAAPAVLASLTLPADLSFISAKWEKEGSWYSDGNLSRTGSFDGKTVTCGIGELWSGMKATITLRVSAAPGQYSLGVKVEDLSALYEVVANSKATLTLTLS